MYRDPAIAKLIEKLNAEGPAKLKGKYYIGDPMIVAESLLPICFISKDKTGISNHTNAEDAHNMPIVINVVGKFANDLNNKSFVQAGTSMLYEMCEARNDSYDLLPSSIAYILRKYQVLDSANKLYIDHDTETDIDYVLSPPSRRGIFSTEAVIRLTLRNNQLNPGVQ